MTSKTAEPTARYDKIVIARQVWTLAVVRPAKHFHRGTWRKRCIVCGALATPGQTVYGPRDRSIDNPMRYVRFHLACIDFVDHRPHRAGKIQMMAV